MYSRLWPAVSGCYTQTVETSYQKSRPMKGTRAMVLPAKGATC